MEDIYKDYDENDRLMRCKCGQNVSFISRYSGGLVNQQPTLRFGSYIYRSLILQRIRQLHSVRVPIGSHGLRRRFNWYFDYQKRLLR
jgi:hypothetical protein